MRIKVANIMGEENFKIELSRFVSAKKPGIEEFMLTHKSLILISAVRKNYGLENGKQ